MIARLLCALLALVSCSAIAHADEAQQALQQLNEGVELYEKNELAQARDAFIRARDLFPQKPNPHRWLGLTEARLGHCTEAIIELELFLESVPPRDARTFEATAVRNQCRDLLDPRPTEPIVAPTAPLVVAAPPTALPSRKRRAWIAGVVVGAVAVLGLAVGLGTRGDSPTVYPPVGGK